MDANQGEPWSEMDIKDLRASLDFGNTYADAARMLCRDEDEVRQKAKARTGRATKKMVTSKRPKEKRARSLRNGGPREEASRLNGVRPSCNR
jgi:hypothetical protein